MRRWTENFSMCSDISMQISERSSSNSSSASAFASSVLPRRLGQEKSCPEACLDLPDLRENGGLLQQLRQHRPGMLGEAGPHGS